MKKIRQFYLLLMVSLLMFGSLTVPAYAEEVQGKELNVNGEGSGYKIVIPNFVENKKVQTKDSNGKTVQVDVIVIERPTPNKRDDYLIFNVVKTGSDKSYAVDALSKTFSGDELDSFHGGFVNNQVSFEIGLNKTTKEMKDFPKDTVFDFNFSTSDPDWNTVFTSKGLYFMLVEPGTKPSNGDAADSANQGGGTTTRNEGTSAAVTANPASSKVVVDGKVVAFQAYNIGGSNYFKLRDLAMAVNGSGKQFQIGWDDVHKAIQLSNNKAYTSDGTELAVSGISKPQSAKSGSSKIFIDGKEVQLTAYSIGGYNYFKLRDIAKEIDFNVTWDVKNNSIGIDTTSAYSEPN
ncbi:hypothetical protein [Cohnella sp.]|uniref:hypothetical protein n=1 Tax=Cohnella sp. TaxID=1883426 RepID=UPI0035691AC5